MTKAGLARRNLLSAQADAVCKLNEALEPLGRKVWRVSETDGMRLIRLRVWSEKYSVSIGYIVEAVLGGLSRAVERRTGKKNKTGLGVTIPVLTGGVAKQILLERIAKDFPGGENQYSATEQRRDDMMNALDGETNGRPKNPLDYSKPQNFTEAYVSSIKRKRKEREELEEQIAAMPFRGNPFQ